MSFAGGVLNVVFASVGAVALGFTGLAWGSALAQSAAMHVVPIVFGLRMIGITYREFFRTTALRALLFAAALAVAAAGVKWALHGIFGAGGAPVGRAMVTYLASGICATTLAAGLLAWGLVLTRDDRGYFLGLLRRRSV